MSDSLLLTDYKEQIDSVISRLLQHEPIQYIFGHTEWGGLDLKVSPDVLIPRPETAELIDIVESRTTKAGILRILDIGTGTGCLAIGLKKCFSQAEVIGIDISEATLQTACENAKRNNTEVKFYQADALQLGFVNPRRFNGLKTDLVSRGSNGFKRIFSLNSQLSTKQLSTLNSELSTKQLSTPFDIIVSNPPYITESEKAGMDANVLDYEPHMALFVPDNDPLVFYRAIARFAAEHLEPHGILAVEINQRFGAETKELVQSIMPDATVELLNDDYGNDRFIIVEI